MTSNVTGMVVMTGVVMTTAVMTVMVLLALRGWVMRMWLWLPQCGCRVHSPSRLVVVLRWCCGGTGGDGGVRVLLRTGVRRGAPYQHPFISTYFYMMWNTWSQPPPPPFSLPFPPS